MPKKGEIGSLVVDRQDGSKRWAFKHWHSLGTLLYPQDQKLFEGDLHGLIREWVLPGHTPDAGTLSASDGVIALGSCFAGHLRDYLDRAGVPSALLWIPADLNNSYAIRDFVSWCVSGRETARGFSYTRTDEGEIRKWTPAAERERYLDAIRGAGAFVFTFGLSEVWEDTETGGVFWRGIPQELFETGRYAFRLTTVEENEANIREIIELVRSVNPAATIVLTLSPVPLKATFRGISCITADCVSKATLRVALDRALAAELQNVYYWPSFEVVRWVGSNLPTSAYGAGDGRSRHVSPAIVAEIISAFLESFYTPAAVTELRARAARRAQDAGSKPRGGGAPHKGGERRPRLSGMTRRALSTVRRGLRP